MAPGSSGAAALRLVAVTVRSAAAAATAGQGGAASTSAAATTTQLAPPRRTLGDVDAFLFAWRGNPTTTPAPPNPSSSLPPISSAATLADGAVLLAAHAREAGERRLEREWRAVEEAPPRTLKHWLHRLANAVLSRSDPIEAALARIPRSLDAHSPAVAAAIRRARPQSTPTSLSLSSSSAEASPPPTPQQQHHPHHHHQKDDDDDDPAFEILHPASLDPRLVRRLLRRLCQKRAPEHRRGALLWALALVPQAPLSVLPLPNVTVYYTLWRVFMHWSASVGAKSLLGALDRLSDEQRRALARAAAAATGGGGGSSGGATRDSSSTSATTTTPSPAPLPAPLLVARDDLPSPLAGPADADRLAALLEQPHVVERFRALASRMERRRRKAGGSSGAPAAGS